ncbi:hypothetical protein ACS0TY_006147 [Phlomoides rotata]
MRNMHNLVMVSDDDCKDQLRMDRASFHKLCGLVRTFGGLKSSRNISVEEKYIFLVPAQSVDVNTLDARWGKFQGSAADSRVLRDAIHRNNGLHVPRGVRYHLSEWSSRQPQTYQEYFNMKHTRARNVIERTFGLLKMRWGILRSPSWYPIKTTNKIIVACCLLHNYIGREMDVDPLEGGLDKYMSTHMDEEPVHDVDVIENLETSTEWNTWRDKVAHYMFNE